MSIMRIDPFSKRKTLSVSLVWVLFPLLLFLSTPLPADPPLPLFRTTSPSPLPPTTLGVTSRVLIGIYQRWITPANGPSCTFIPTCSAYTLSAIERYGFWGILMGAERILRDHSRTELYPLRVYDGQLRPYDPPSAHAPFPQKHPHPFHLIPR